MTTFCNSRHNIETHYDAQADIFTVYVARNFRGCIDYFRDAIENEVLVGYASSDAIVLIDIWGAAELVNVNPENRSTLLDQESGVLSVTLSNEPANEWKGTDIDHVFIGYSDSGKIVGFQIIDGQSNVARTLIEDEAL